MLSTIGSIASQGGGYASLLHFDGSFKDENSSNLWRAYLQEPYGNSPIVNKSVSALTLNDGYGTTFDGEKSSRLSSGASLNHPTYNSAFATTNDVMPPNYYGDFTISLHCKVTVVYGTYGDTDVIAGLRGDNNIGFRLSSVSYTDDYYAYVIYRLSYIRKKQDGTMVSKYLQSPPIKLPSTWNFIKFGKKGTTCFLVIDGVKYSYDLGAEHTSYYGDTKLCVGGDPNKPYQGGCWGLIDEVCLRVGIGDDSATIQTTPF